jgi:ubiquinone/menaquinone biosynthesis C-methylase UbiE
MVPKKKERNLLIHLKNKSHSRFDNLVENYALYRPKYPDELPALLEQKSLLDKTDIIADIGCGTGISSELFLKNGYNVIGIEPGDKMYAYCKKTLSNYPNFSIVKGNAQNTLLKNTSVNTIIAAQAFHWFNNTEAKKEFLRILKPKGRLIIIWNERLTEENEFSKSYENLIIKYSTDYKSVDHRNITNWQIEEFFKPFNYSFFSLNNKQILDYKGLEGRLLSSSYIIKKTNSKYENMLTELKVLYNKFQINNYIQLNYITKIYAGKINT